MLEEVIAAQHEELEAAMLEIARLREENSALKTEVGVRRAQERVSSKAQSRRADPVKRAVDTTLLLQQNDALQQQPPQQEESREEEVVVAAAAEDPEDREM